MASVEQQLQQEIASYTLDPKGFVRFAYPWGHDDLKHETSPRAWQDDVLTQLTEHLKNPATRYTPCRLAVASGHGIGKSTLIAWLIGWGMSTMEDCRIIVTAGTGPQLATKTVPEVTKWFNRLINKHWWDVKATSVTVRAPRHERTWRTDFMTWNEHNPEAFAGLHNVEKRIILIYDEASGVADIIWETSEGALTDERTQIIWLVFGNPTRATGRFKQCFTTLSKFWKTWQIDARDVPGTNKALFAQWAESYGEDSPFFKIRVKGEFCASGIDQLIPTEVVDACRKYKSRGHEGLPKIMSIDVARFGDDRSIIGDRQGRYHRILGKYQGIDTEQLADKAIELIQLHDPDAVVVDGDGLGAGVVDKLKHRGYKDLVHEFHGMHTPWRPMMYFNARSEAWGLMAETLKAGAELPQDPELVLDLTEPMYSYNSKQQLQLESKDDMRSRGVMSPDIGDMFAMTYRVKIAPKRKKERQERQDVFTEARAGDYSWM